jgi:leader peptidase (prepilin peptidase)/N-methyltransferase
MSALLGGSLWVAARALAGAAIAGALYVLVWLISRGGFGFGDVRFAPLLGAAAAAGSWTLLWLSLLLGTVVGGGAGLLRLAKGQREAFPYAPSMLAGAYAACVLMLVTCREHKAQHVRTRRLLQAPPACDMPSPGR